MTAQQVNLLADDLRPRTLLFSAEHALFAWLATVVVLGAISTVDIVSISRLGAEIEAVKNELRKVNDAMTLLQSQVAAVEDPALAARVAALRSDARTQRTLLTALEGGEVLQSRGFSGHLHDLAGHAVQGLWLTGMVFDARTDSVKLEGEAERAVLVPRLLKALAAGKRFDGQAFGGVEVVRTDSGTARFVISAPDASPIDSAAIDPGSIEQTSP